MKSIEDRLHRACHCQKPDIDEPMLKCGAPLPCNRHTIRVAIVIGKPEEMPPHIIRELERAEKIKELNDSAAFKECGANGACHKWLDGSGMICTCSQFVTPNGMAGGNDTFR